MKTILLVDDERAYVRLLRMSLELDGFRIADAFTLQQAHAKLSTDIAALIVDYNLAQGDVGTELIKNVRNGKTAVSADVPIVATSGDDRREAEALEVGADTFMLKPFSPAKLTDTLKQLINKKPHE